MSTVQTKYDSIVNFDVFVRLNVQNVFISLSSFNELFSEKSRFDFKINAERKREQFIYCITLDNYLYVPNTLELFNLQCKLNHCN